MEHKKALLYKKPSIRTVCMLLCIMLFLCGCGASTPRAEAEPTDPPQDAIASVRELKPYILCNGAQEGEWALDMDFVTMVYTFDYELKDTTILPKDWMSTSSLIF